MVNRLGMEYNKELGENEMSGYESDKSEEKYKCKCDGVNGIYDFDNTENKMMICDKCGLTPCVESRNENYESGYECCYCGREGEIVEESLD